MCAVSGCSHSRILPLHRFPKDVLISKEWKRRCNNKKLQKLKVPKICTKHFEETAYKRDLEGELLNLKNGRRLLVKDALPTLFLHENEPLDQTNLAHSSHEILGNSNCPDNSTAEDESMEFSQDQNNFAHYSSVVLENYKDSNESESIPEGKSNLSIEESQNWKKMYEESCEKVKKLEKLVQKSSKLKHSEKKNITKTYLKDMGYSEIQVKHLLNPTAKHHKNYTEIDICSALVLWSMSTRSYEYIRKNKILPLPSRRRTLFKWLDDLACKPGMSNNFLKIVEKKIQNSSPMGKKTVLCFDEITIKNCYEYDHRNKQVYGNSKKVQVVLARGLFSSWKQVIFFDFNKNMDKKLINDLILKCGEHGLDICGLAFDLGKFFKI